MAGVDDYLGPGGAIAERLPGYEERPQQLELARAIEATLGERGHLLAEAGTGVGKSFAYLLPAVLHAIAHRGSGPVVVATRTIALQEQLERKDLPFLQAVLPLEWTAVTAVGRGHYVCLRRMQLAHRERGALFPDPVREAQLQRVVDWSLTTGDGTRMDLPEPVDDAVWDEVRAEHGNCLYRACAHYESCPYQRARRRFESAHVLVVNHALYLADVALRMAGARYLPDHRVAIFDEAHHLERNATESLGLRVTLGTVLWHLRRLHPQRARRSLLHKVGSPRALRLFEDLRTVAEEFFGALEDSLGGAKERTLALGDRVLDDPVGPLLGELADELVGGLVRVDGVDLKMETKARVDGLRGLQAVLGRLCTADATGATVRWIEGGRRSPELRSAPLDVAETLRRFVFGGERSCVLVSATLGPSGDPDFAWLRRQLGVDNARTLRLGSPFDYRRAVRVEIPDAIPDPVRQPDEHLRASREAARDLVVGNGGRALVLCTSWKSVRAFAETLRDPLGELGIPLLVQGERPMRALLADKRAQPMSVLVGTESLWEGIDVPGDALTLVIVTRLPFATPDHPLTKARLRRIEERGGDPFAEQSLPDAVLKFRQGFGRLIRSGEDHGRVVLLDPRARTRGYGRRFLEALPEGVLDDPFW